MTDLVKQDMTHLWAVTGDIVAPDTTKIESGWAVETVPRQWWNWMQNRVDTNVAYMLQKGIPEWDGSTEYIINKSYVQYLDVIYKCIATNTGDIPASVPASWKKALVESTASMEALKSVTPAADRLAYFTNGTTATVTPFTAFARTLLDDTTATAARTTLGAQALDATLTAMAGVTTGVNSLIYFTGADVAASTTLTAFARTLIDDVDAVSARSTLDVYSTTQVDSAINGSAVTKQPLDATLTALAGLATGVNTLPYFTGTNTAAQTAFTAFARTLLDDVDATTARSTLGLGTAATSTVQTSTTDAAAGRVMINGAWGIGAAAPAIASTADDLQVGSIYRYETPEATAVGSYNLPALGGSNTRGWIVYSHGSASRVIQRAVEVFGLGTTKGRTFTRTKHDAVWSPWDETWTGNNLAKQTSTTDATAGRVLLTGAFGLGEAGVASGNFDTILVNGLYYGVDAVGTPASGVAVQLLHQQYATSSATQIAYRVSDHKMWMRYKNTNWSAWVELWHGGNLIKQTSTSDTTAGRVLLNGAHGLGELTLSTGNNLSSINNIGLPTGMYAYVGFATGSPSGANPGVLIVERYSASASRQIAMAVNGSSDVVSMWTRQIRSGPVYGAWVEMWHSGNMLDIGTTAGSARTALALGSAATRTALGSTGSLYSRDSILGSVGQSGGVPTGAVIQRGSNANGEYVRYADGTQVCWKLVSTGAFSANTSAGAAWTFPAVFSAIPTVSTTIESTDPQVYNASCAVPTASAVTVYAGGTSGGVGNVHSVAIGRWF